MTHNEKSTISCLRAAKILIEDARFYYGTEIGVAGDQELAEIETKLDELIEKYEREYDL